MNDHHATVKRYTLMQGYLEYEADDGNYEYPDAGQASSGGSRNFPGGFRAEINGNCAQYDQGNTAFGKEKVIKKN